MKMKDWKKLLSEGKRLVEAVETLKQWDGKPGNFYVDERNKDFIFWVYPLERYENGVINTLGFDIEI